MKQQSRNTKSRYQQVADDIRQQIIQGDVLPGEKLPTFDDMVASYDTSRSIVQLAVSQLRDLGFVRSDGRRGMFVADSPPHLYRFGILFPGHPGDAYWSRFNTSLIQEAGRLQAQTPSYRFEFYYDLLDKAMSDDFARLMDDVQQQTLAGIIEMPFCDYVIQRPEVQVGQVPVLHLFGPDDSDRLPSLTTDHFTFLRKRVVPEFKSLGVSRVATVSLADHPSTHLLSMFESSGLQTRRSWLQYVSRDHPETIRRIIWLLFDQAQVQQPDGLLILDDNLVEHVMLGLNDCGIRPGRDIHVFSQNNWPSDIQTMMPMHRFGVHTGQLLIQACRTLERMRHGDDFPAYQIMPSWFDFEIPASVTFDDKMPDCQMYEYK